jgi:hypothetical protein
MNKNQEKKEIFGIKPSDINKIEIDKTKFDIDYELKLVDSKGSGITKFAEINDNKAIKAELKIILSNKNHNARDNDQPEQVVYHLQNTDFKINEGKIIVDKSNQKNLENKLKKAYQKLIQENPKTVATLVTDTDDVYFTFTENASEITINLQRDLTKNTQRVITANNISIELI